MLQQRNWAFIIRPCRTGATSPFVCSQAPSPDRLQRTAQAKRSAQALPWRSVPARSTAPPQALAFRRVWLFWPPKATWPPKTASWPPPSSVPNSPGGSWAKPWSAKPALSCRKSLAALGTRAPTNTCSIPQTHGRKAINSPTHGATNDRLRPYAQTRAIAP